MHEELFKIGSLTVYTYGFLIAIGLICAIVMFYFLSKKFKLSEASFNFYSTAVIISIVIGFLFAMLFQSVYDWIASGFKSFRFGKMTFMGGLIGGVGLFLAITAIFAKGQVKRDFWKTANLMAPCIPLAHGFGRIGCYFGGCCYGIVSDSPLAIQCLPYESVTRLPTHIFEAVFLFVLCGAMLFMLFKFKRIDLQLLTYLAAYAVWRFIIEFFRDKEPLGSFIPGITPSQFQSIVMLLVFGALALYIFYFDRIPFCGKQKIGRAFKDVALAEVYGETQSISETENSEESEETTNINNENASSENDVTQQE